MTYFTARALDAFPFLEVYETTDRNQEPVQYSLTPPPASAVRRVRFSPEMNQMAAVYDMRIYEMPVIGNPSELVPPDGIRVFSGDDAYLLFGGSSTARPVMYRRAGPTYMRLDNLIELPEEPGYFTHAAFTSNGEYLALVTSNNPGLVEIHQRDGYGKYVRVDYVYAPTGNLENVSFSPSDTFLVVTTDAVTTLFEKTGSTYQPVIGFPSGRILAISPADEFYVVDNGNSAEPLSVYRLDQGIFTLVSELEQTAGTDRKAKFSPEGIGLAVCGVFSGGPRVEFFSLLSDQWIHRTSYPFGSPSMFLNGELSFSRDSTKFAYSYRHGSEDYRLHLFDRETLTTAPFERLSDFTPPENAYGSGAICISQDGQYLAAAQNASPYIQIYKRSGDTFEAISDSSLWGASRPATLSFSPDSVYLAVGYTSYSYFVLYKRDGDTFSLLATPSLPANSSVSGFAWSPDGDLLTLIFSGSPYRKVYQRVGDTFSEITGPTLPSATFNAVAFSPDGTFMAFAQSSSPYVRVFRRSGTTFTPVSIAVPGTYASALSLAFSPDSRRLYVGLLAAPYFDIYEWNGSSFVRIGPPALSLSSLVRSIHVADDGSHILLGTSGFPRFYSVENNTFTLLGDFTPLLVSGAVSYSMSGDGAYIVASHATAPYVSVYKSAPSQELVAYVWSHVDYSQVLSDLKVTFSPDGSLVHCDNRHIETESPYGTPPRLPLTDDYPPSAIRNVLYSHKGDIAIYDLPAGPSMSVQQNAGSYVEVSSLDGTFVSVYNINRGAKSISEKAFVNHPVGTEITDLVFSDTPVAFSYFALNGEDDPSATQGRHIYNTADASILDFKGNEFEEGMLASYVAFAPSEEYFAVTYHYENAPSEVVLYKFIDGNLNYEVKDRKPVPFGPVDFSDCDKILVAHGGREKPFTIFQLDRGTDTLVERPYPPINWEHEGLILDIGFIDCEKIAVLTPEELVTVELPEDGEGEAVPEELDSVQRDDDQGDDVDMDIRDPGDVTIQPVTPDGGTGHYDIGDDGHITPMTYPPYVAINVFYRE